MGAITALFNSEKAVAGGLLIICSTVLVGLGYLPAASWVNYTQWIFGIYVAGKTATSSVAMITSGGGSPASPAAPAAPAAEVVAPKEA